MSKPSILFAVTATSLWGLCMSGCDFAGKEATSVSALRSFNAGPCKKHQVADIDGLVPRAGISAEKHPELAGLQCMVWRTDTANRRLLVDLVNFHEGCGVEWEGDVEVASDGITLKLINPGCAQASCGWCIYDWSFDVETAAAESDLPVTITVDDCPDKAGVNTTLHAEIPAASESGRSCRYANFYALEDQAATLGGLGTAFMPCSGAEMNGGGDASSWSCGEGLVCTDVTGREYPSPICLPSCEVDADCPLPELLTCDAAGACVIAAPWDAS